MSSKEISAAPPVPDAANAVRDRMEDLDDLHLSDHLARANAAMRADAGVDVIRSALELMVSHPQYPCLGARSVFKRGNATIETFDCATEETCLESLSQRLSQFGATPRDRRDFASFIAVFRTPRPHDEAAFERLLWSVLQRLHDMDDAPWAPNVSACPDAPDFSFSLAGTPFFVVGLHPGASRIARRAPLPTLVFNLHAQFEQLREDGGFDRMRDAIRKRDLAVQGTPNPMTDDHGSSSEARQYSGRAVDEAWHAPFTSEETPHD